MRKFFRHFIDPLTAFIHDSRAIGITLLSCTILSLCLANFSITSETFTHFWHMSFDGTAEHHFHASFLSLPNSPLVIINDLLMAFFFCLAGMEIKREMVNGELSSFKKSLLPIAAAIGGMIVPAIIFAQFNRGGNYMNGWAIPTATDIAFTLGIASLLGKRVPVSLKIFLTALAIIDDLGAIIVIALFYGGDIQWMYLLCSAVIVAAILLLNKRKINFGILHIVLGLLLWYCMFNSGIHATVAGVVFAFLIPTELLKRFELKMHIPVYFIIIPLFALANTAIVLPANALQTLNSSLSWGIIAGLCMGKPLGICLAVYVLVNRKWADLPSGVDWHKIIGAGMLAGIGFTMSIFISTLAFNEAATQDIAKISVLIASVIAMIAGYALLRWEKKDRSVIEMKG